MNLIDAPFCKPSRPGGCVRRAPAGSGSDRSAGAGAEGRCSLVGAGPGDPELLTVKAVKAIQSASLLLVDDLVSDGVIALARADARVLRVGKRGGRASTPQSFIEELTLAAVRRGEHVVRLKGGDPFVFGRGGEELAHLAAQGIAVEVINGITAGLAAPSSLGVALTHRDHAQGVVFVTGHTQPGVQGVDFEMLGRTAQAARLTLVIYMGMRQAHRLVAALLKSMVAHTPAAVIQQASLAQQRHALCTLGSLGQTLREGAFGSPGILVIGDVILGARALQADLAAPGPNTLPEV